MGLSGTYTTHARGFAGTGNDTDLYGGVFRSGKTRTATVFLFLVVLSSALAPVLTPYGCNQMDLDKILAPPSLEHLLGTDEVGRDLFTRLLYGGRYSLLIAFGSVLISLLIGIITGSASGYFDGRLDSVISILMDLFLSIPVFLVLLVLGALCSGKVWLIPVIIGSFSWMEVARIVRAEFLSIRNREFVSAARSIGAGHISLVFKHILPLTFGPVVVAATAGLAQAMLAESALSFLGLGVQPPVPTWGNMLRNAQVFIQSSPLTAFAPGFMIFIVCLSFNIIGDGLSEAFSRD